MSVRRFTSLSLLSFPSFCFIKAVSLIHLVVLTDYHKFRDIRNTFSYTFPEQFFLVLVNGHQEYLHSATRLKESLFLSNCSVCRHHFVFYKKDKKFTRKTLLFFNQLPVYKQLLPKFLFSSRERERERERERGSFIVHISFCHILIFYDYFKVVIMQIFIENKNMTHVHGISKLTHVV